MRLTDLIFQPETPSLLPGGILPIDEETKRLLQEQAQALRAGTHILADVHCQQTGEVSVQLRPVERPSQ